MAKKVKNETDLLLQESEKMLKGLVGEEQANEIFSNMFPEPIKGYKKGKILTVGELKKLPEGSTIHLWYKDDSGSLRSNEFLTFSGYDGDDELSTTDGFTMPVHGLADDTPIEQLENGGWYFTVREAVKK